MCGGEVIRVGHQHCWLMLCGDLRNHTPKEVRQESDISAIGEGLVNGVVDGAGGRNRATPGGGGKPRKGTTNNSRIGIDVEGRQRRIQ